VGDAAVVQMFVRANLASHGSTDFLAVCIAYGLAAAFAVYICGGVSGGHINPAVTFTMCLYGRLKWYKMPVYWAGQYLGAFVGAALLYFTYFDSIAALNALKKADGESIVFTPGIFATYPLETMNIFPALLDQVVGTAILLIVVFALTDSRNAAVPKHLVPLCVGLTIGMIGMSYGIQCGFAINPARDFAPRLFTLIWHGAEVFSKGSKNFHYFFWIPVVGPHIGAIIGAFLYQALIGAHWPAVYEVTHHPTSNAETVTVDHSLHPTSPTAVETEILLSTKNEKGDPRV